MAKRRNPETSLPTIKWSFEDENTIVVKCRGYRLYVMRIWGADDVKFYGWSVHYKNMIEDWDWFEQPIAITGEEAIDYATISFYFAITDHKFSKFVHHKKWSFKTL